MSDQKPSVGRIVHYTLNEGDVNMIANQRLAAGHRTHNVAKLGDTYPATVVRVFDPSSTTANLQVHLDGTDTYWATSRQEGQPGEAGHWAWPPRV